MNYYTIACTIANHFVRIGFTASVEREIASVVPQGTLFGASVGLHLHK